MSGGRGRCSSISAASRLEPPSHKFSDVKAAAGKTRDWGGILEWECRKMNRVAEARARLQCQSGTREYKGGYVHVRIASSPQQQSLSRSAELQNAEADDNS